MISEIISAFEQRSNRDNAEKMAAYMRNKFEFYGIKADERKALQKHFFARMNRKYDASNRWELVREMWEKPQREWVYFAVDWTKTFPPKTLRPEDIHEIHFLLTNHSWWDSVDLLASNILGEYNRQFPENQALWLDDWRESDNFWLRRSCLIHQLKYKNETDFNLLKSLIRENQHDPEFFIQKAIGWALRQYGKYQPEVVKAFVETENITGLAKREALKLLK